MYHTQKSRSDIVIDPNSCDPKMLTHGRVAWLQVPESKTRVPVYWDMYEKKFLALFDFRVKQESRAAANRERHALIPFGAQGRARRKQEEGAPLPPPLSGWARA